jgi:hypothetical protein
VSWLRASDTYCHEVILLWGPLIRAVDFVVLLSRGRFSQSFAARLFTIDKILDARM